jgi:hypothetical protein
MRPNARIWLRLALEALSIVVLATDSASYQSLGGNFLFGGPVADIRSVDPGCDSAAGAGICDTTYLDGVWIRPGALVDGTVVVVRAHWDAALGTVVLWSVVGSYWPYSAEYAKPAPGAGNAPATLGEATYPFGAPRAS